MKVIVTGASGYLGVQLCHYLSRQQIQVLALTRTASSRLNSSADKSLQVFTGEKNWHHAFESKADCVIHLGGFFSNDETQAQEIYEANFGFAQRILKLARASGIKSWLQAGSYWQFDSQGKVSPLNFYASLKQAFHEELQLLSEETDFQFVDLVLYDIYGPGDWRAKLLPSLLKAARESSSEAFALSSGEQIVSFVHVDDVVEAFRLALALMFAQGATKSSTYFLHDEQRALKDYIETFRAVGGSNLKLGWGQRENPKNILKKPYFGPRLPGWSPQVRFDEALKGLSL